MNRKKNGDQHVAHVPYVEHRGAKNDRRIIFQDKSTSILLRI
jgi:hypothetical protein